jgi:hypothetical protein
MIQRLVIVLISSGELWIVSGAGARIQGFSGYRIKSGMTVLLGTINDCVNIRLEISPGFPLEKGGQEGFAATQSIATKPVMGGHRDEMRRMRHGHQSGG